MRPVRCVVLFSLLLLPASLAVARGPSEEKKKLIDEYIEVTRASETMRETVRLMFERFEGQVVEASEEEITEQVRARFKRLAERIVIKLDPVALTEEVYPPLLDEYYSEDDLRQLIAFYKTDVGQKVVEVQPRLTVDLQTALGRVMIPMVQEVTDEVDKEIDEEKTRKFPARAALRDLRILATATEAWATDYDKYPAARDLSELDKELSPTYVRTMPRKDPWGEEYVYVVSADRMQYRFVSGGADGRIDASSLVISSLDENAETIENRSADQDIIFQDGMFVAAPKEPDEE